LEFLGGERENEILADLRWDMHSKSSRHGAGGSYAGIDFMIYHRKIAPNATMLLICEII